MKKIMIGLMAMASLSSHASGFKELEELFKQGTVPNTEELVGLNIVGRCFKENAPTTPIASGIILSDIKRPGEIGVHFYYESPTFAKANHFDHMSKEDVFKEIPSLKNGQASRMHISETGIYKKFHHSNEELRWSSYELRENGDYIIEEHRTYNGTEKGPLVKEKVRGRCYYFIKNR